MTFATADRELEFSSPWSSPSLAPTAPGRRRSKDGVRHRSSATGSVVSTGEAVAFLRGGAHRRHEQRQRFGTLLLVLANVAIAVAIALVIIASLR